MSNYTMFAEKLEITPEARKWLGVVLKYDVGGSGAEGLFDLLELDDDGTDLCDWPHFEWRVNKTKTFDVKDCLTEEYLEFKLYAMGECNFDHVELLMTSLIKKFLPDTIFELNAAHFTDKPHSGQFGGGWMVISRDGVVTGNTWRAAESVIDEILESRGEA